MTDLSFAGLLQNVEGLAERLCAHGVAAGGRVVVALPAGRDDLEARLGVLLAGAAIVPALPSEAEAVRDAVGATHVLTAESLRALRSSEPGSRPRLAVPRPDDPAFVLRTSGDALRTVTIDHATALRRAMALAPLGITADDVVLLVGPTPGLVVQSVGLYALLCGATVAAADGPWLDPTLVADVQPTLIVCTPAAIERLHAELVGEAERSGGLGKLALEWAVRIGCRATRADDEGRPLPWLDKAQHFVATRVVGDELSRRLGGRVRSIVTGGARLAEPVQRALAGLGVEVLTTYGIAEAGGLTHVSRPGRLRCGTVGAAIDGVRSGVDGDGALVLWLDGPVTLGGEIQTGDLAAIDADGIVTLLGRRGHAIVVPPDRLVHPEALESELRAQPLVQRALVHGAGRPFLSALIWLDEQQATAWAQAHDLPVEGLARHPALFAEIGRVVERVNRTLRSFEVIAKFAIVETPIDPSNGDLSAAGDLRRGAVESSHRALLDSFYTDRF